MVTNIDIDSDLIAKAMEISGARTKREVVDRALREMVARAKRPRMRDLWGVAADGGFWDDYDPKAAPGEAPGKYRVEEGIPTYKVPPAPQPKPRRKR